MITSVQRRRRWPTPVVPAHGQGVRAERFEAGALRELTSHQGTVELEGGPADGNANVTAAARYDYLEADSMRVSLLGESAFFARDRNSQTVRAIPTLGSPTSSPAWLPSGPTIASRNFFPGPGQPRASRSSALESLSRFALLPENQARN